MKIFVSLFLFFEILAPLKTYSFVHIKKSLHEDKITIFSVFNENDEYVVRVYSAARGHLQEFVKEERFQEELEYRSWLNKHKVTIDQKDQNIIKEYVVETEDEHGFVWKSVNTWNDSWEEKYGQWIQNEVSINFFKDHNIVVDCADVAYALRWIFSRINSLPMQVTVDGSKARFSNMSFRKSWNSLSRNSDWQKDQVFMASLRYIFDITGTSTIENDTKPVKADRKNLRPGLINFLGYHTQVISEVNISKDQVTKFPVWVFESTVPASARVLKNHILSLARNVRQFVNKDKSNQNIDFSELPVEKLDIINFTREHNITKDWEKVASDLIQDFSTKINGRDEVVLEGYEKCKIVHCDENSKEYDDWSTFSRDKRLLTDYELLKENLEVVSRIISKNFDWLSTLDNTIVKISQGEFSIPQIMKLFQNYYIISDPNYKPDERWGASLNVVIDSRLNSLKKNIKKRIQFLQHSQDETFALDSKIKKDLAVIITVCENEEVYCEELKNITDFTWGISKEEILNFVSDSHASIEERWGKSSKQLKSSVFYVAANLVQEIADGVFIANNKLVNTKTKLSIDLKEILGHKFKLNVSVKSFKVRDEDTILLLFANVGSYETKKLLLNLRTFKLTTLKVPHNSTLDELNYFSFINVDNQLLSYEFSYSDRALKITLLNVNDEDEIYVSDFQKLNQRGEYLYLNLLRNYSIDSQYENIYNKQGILVEEYGVGIIGIMKVVDHKLRFESISISDFNIPSDTIYKLYDNKVSFLFAESDTLTRVNNIIFKVFDLRNSSVNIQEVKVSDSCVKTYELLDSFHFVCDESNKMTLYSFDHNQGKIIKNEIEDFVFDSDSSTYYFIRMNNILKLNNDNLSTISSFVRNNNEKCNFINKDIIECNLYSLKLHDEYSVRVLFQSSFSVKLIDILDPNNTRYFFMPKKYATLGLKNIEVNSTSHFRISYLPNTSNYENLLSKTKATTVKLIEGKFYYLYSQVGEVATEDEQDPTVVFGETFKNTSYERINQGYVFHYFPTN